ncbi:MAG: hydantoinase B/oxoprolinase family protein [Gammaproteobacteria bacterium]|nr:hydantoinase B/oxoprolinase family protein [Gammaproteobacteria bacterium]MCY4357955.1 hydantoinase B/oxoprolinase family protein [Gammaproteobacteria bacterium]
MNPIELKLFSSRVSAICDEMGLVLKRTSFSPNIKDRLDFSCALFGPQGELFEQAAHIPVHLGSMAFAMTGIVSNWHWQAGDMLVVNDPYLGGTHLPDVTMIAPVFSSQGNELLGFVANRAHHANIGCDTPGSMPISMSLQEEGIIIPPSFLYRQGKLQAACMNLLGFSNQELSGDFAAQVGANQIGVQRLQELVTRMGGETFRQGMYGLQEYADRIAANTLASLKPGVYTFEDFLDDDGIGNDAIPLKVSLQISKGEAVLDFSGSSPMVPGNLNCPEPVVAAAVFYCFRCLMPDESPSNIGLFRRIHIQTEAGSIVNAQRPAAVAAGNVETSTRLVDLVFGALAKALPKRIPAASQGSMNNIAVGHVNSKTQQRWDYYETLAGGIGGGPSQVGLDGVHSHMTNTLNTPVESLEMHYPLRVWRYALRKGSGGVGKNRGGDGVIREYEFLEPAQLSILTERRKFAPWGLQGGQSGETGENRLNGVPLPGKCSLAVKSGDRLVIKTPGGGGWGLPKQT